jgi:hypothetical protein
VKESEGSWEDGHWRREGEGTGEGTGERKSEENTFLVLFRFVFPKYLG